MRTAYLAGLCSLLVLGLVGLTAARADDKGGEAKKLIVGKWIPEKEQNKGTLEFAKDGKLNIKFQTSDGKEVEVKGTYKFTADDKMDIELTGPDGKTHKESLTVKVTKDELTTTDSKNMTQKFKRAK
jgi:uncharacterized protein (TIGR03066 family)